MIVVLFIVMTGPAEGRVWVVHGLPRTENGVGGHDDHGDGEGA
jgi:hypothetical protein